MIHNFEGKKWVLVIQMSTGKFLRNVAYELIRFAE